MKSKLISIKVNTDSQRDIVKKVDHPKYTLEININESKLTIKLENKIIELVAHYLGLTFDKISILTDDNSDIKLLEIHE